MNRRRKVPLQGLSRSRLLRKCTPFLVLILVLGLVKVGLSFTRMCSSCDGYPTVCLRWFPVNGMYGVKGGIYINPNCEDEYAVGASESDAVRSAMNTWNGADFNFTFIYSGETDHRPFHAGDDPDSTDEMSVIGWTDLSLGYGVLARTYDIFECDTGEIVEADIEFADYERWSALETPPPLFPSWYDVESIALHELGHVLGLNHTPISTAAMYYSIGPGSVKRDLHADDISGVRSLYGRRMSAVDDFCVYE